MVSPDDDKNIEEYIKDADILMYEQKHIAHKRDPKY